MKLVPASAGWQGRLLALVLFPSRAVLPPAWYKGTNRPGAAEGAFDNPYRLRPRRFAMLGAEFVESLSRFIDSPNQVVVINNGEIVEQRTHKELLNLREFHHHLYLSQFKVARDIASGSVPWTTF